MRHLQSRTLISLVFLALTAASSVFIVSASLNYLKLYPALSQLDVGLSQVALGNLTASVSVFASNPVDYTGLSVAGTSISMYFFSGSDYLFNNSRISDTAIDTRPVSPHANTTWIWNVPLNANQSATLLSFSASHNGNVTLHYFLTVSIATFLQFQVGTSPFQKQGDLPLH